MRQTRDQFINSRDLSRAKLINVILTSLHNFELILINSRNCQILMFKTRTFFRVHSINFFIIYYQYYNNLYNVIKKFELILLSNEFFIRLSHEMINCDRVNFQLNFQINL